MARKTISAFVLGAAMASGVWLGYFKHHDDQSFERGRQTGLQECNDPSKLERAAEWLSKP